MRPIIVSSGPPPGYLLEAATVAYSSKRSFTVAREAQCDYGPGTPIILIQQGRLVHAIVDTYVYNGTKIFITPNIPVDPSIIGVYRDASAPFVYGAIPVTFLLYIILRHRPCMIQARMVTIIILPAYICGERLPVFLQACPNLAASAIK